MKKPLFEKALSALKHLIGSATAPKFDVDPLENKDNHSRMVFMTGEPEDGPGMLVSPEELRHMGEPEDYLSPKERQKREQALYFEDLHGVGELEDELEP